MRPKVRFIDVDSTWNNCKLEQCLTIYNERNDKLAFDKSDALSISDESGVVNQIQHLGRSYVGSDVSNYKILHKNQIVYTKSPLKSKPYGIIKCNKGNVGIVSVLYAVYNVEPEIIPDFISRYFEPSQRINKYLLPLINKGAKNTINISDENALQGYIMVPSLATQTRIVEYFDSVDKKLEASAKKVEALKKLKAASLISMFPQNEEPIPKVRFKGFEEEWSTDNLGSIFMERIESNEQGEMLSVTMNNGIIKASDNGRFDNSNSDKSKYKVVKIGDIAYNSMRMWQGASGVSQYEGIVSPAYTVVTPIMDVDTDFFGYLFKTNDVIRLFKLNSQGLTSDNWNLKYPAFSKICVSYPKAKEEQHAIASFFHSLDRKIALETARLEKLKQIKLACLDKMFV